MQRVERNEGMTTQSVLLSVSKHNSTVRSAARNVGDNVRSL